MSRYFIILLITALTIFPMDSFAGVWEASSGFNYNRSEYAGGSYTWTRRWGAALGYNFTDTSQIELSYQNSFDRNHYQNYEDSFFRDEVYSMNWVQNILDKTYMIQPYFKLGAGQLHRKASTTNAVGQSQISETDSFTVVMGIGTRLILTKGFGLRMEGTSFLTAGRLGTWRDNIAVSFGGSLYF
jgi:hypothetical protein